MRCKNLVEAMRQAFANSEASGVPWVVFTDTAGNAHCERQDGQQIEGMTTVLPPVRQWPKLDRNNPPPGWTAEDVDFILGNPQ